MVFLIPFIIFLFQRRFRPSMVRPMIILFLLGALQGAVGWIMVASGLEGDSIYVRPTRLALHFIFALGLLCYTFWFALQLLVNPAERVYNPPAKKWILFIMLLLLGQLLFGALMAGHKAATAAATWPDINGQTIPTGMFRDGLQSIIDNKITIHFIHRGLAYLLVIAVIILTILLLRIKNSSLLRRTRWLPFYLVVLQLVLGIYTVLNSLKIVPNRWGAFEWLAQSHQVVAMLFLLAMLWMIYAIGGRKPDFR
jgi:cytochrome c oxidase assembly protein subunit 15